MENLSNLNSVVETLNVIVEFLGLDLSSLKGVLGVEDELEKLRQTTARIHALLKDAEERIITDESVLGWLAELRDLAFDADDLIDEFQTRLDIRRTELEGSRKRKRSWYDPRSLKDSICLHQWRISRRIQEIKERYDDIAAARERLQLREEDGRRRREHDESVPPAAASLEGNTQILGRDMQKHRILGLLSHPSVIAIVGARGTGKTKLADLVFHDPQVEDLSFLKIWVDVSQDFDEKRILREIIESIDSGQSDLSSLDLQELQLQLKHVTMRKKLLLVLDGVCSEEQSFWETIRDPLMTAAEGSRVLVTARSEIMLKHMHIFSTIRLNARSDMGKKDEVLGLLLEGSRWTTPHIVAIVGAGGIGKTTLARLVFGDVEFKSFQRLWIGVSRDHDVIRITKEIIAAIDTENCGDLSSMSLNLLQLQLQKLVAGKKFLLVFDNVCSEDQSFWETLRAPLMVGSAGSRILVTAQSKSILRYVQASNIINLSGLDDENSKLLLMNHAFKQGSWDRYPDLVSIGEAIARKCQGSPLAIISIGSLLRTRTDEEDWGNVLSNIAELEDEGEMFLTLKVSYDYLPCHLKRCFRFCSIFPNGYEFNREELVKLWIALGIIKPRGTMTLEYLGGRCFDNLLWRSFFQTSVEHKKPKQKFTMPGLVHELAQFVSSYECLRVENDEIPAALNREAVSHQLTCNSRYASLFDCTIESQLLQKIYLNQRLRALVLLGRSSICSKEVLNDIFMNLTCLWALDLRNNKLTEVPDSIGLLVHLRYLNLHGAADLHRLPKSLSNLYNLRVLELGNCPKLLELPKDLCCLVNLRHLGLHLDWETYSDSNDLRTMPAGVDRLASLRTLSRFVVSSQAGCNFTELSRLDLRGEICISKLENVVDADKVKEANLIEKKFLEKMMLRWSKCMDGNSQSRDVEKVIGHLCPPKNLKFLWIENYPGTSFPNWLKVHSLRLETLILSNCGTCEALLSADSEVGSLRKLEIRKCLKLSTLPRLPSLVELVVDEGQAAIISSVCRLTSLSSLTISRFSRLKRMPKDIRNLQSLRKLNIDRSGFDKLALQDLVSLESLVISRCTSLLKFTDDGLPTTLRSLQLVQCDNLHSLPTVLHSLSILHTLDIQAVPRLTSLPALGMPSALQMLTVSGCPNVVQQCQNGRPDWHMIKDIPCVIFDGARVI